MRDLDGIGWVLDLEGGAVLERTWDLDLGLDYGSESASIAVLGSV